MWRIPAEPPSGKGLAGAGFPGYRDVEMHDILAHTQFRIESNRRIVAVVGLHVDDPGPAFGSDALQLADQGRRDALAPGILSDGKIVDVDLAARLLELLQLIGRELASSRAR